MRLNIYLLVSTLLTCSILLLLSIFWWRYQLNPQIQVGDFYYYSLEQKALVKEEKKFVAAKNRMVQSFMDEYKKGPATPYLKNIFFNGVNIKDIFIQGRTLHLDLSRYFHVALDSEQKKLILKAILLTVLTNVPILNSVDVLSFTVNGRPLSGVKMKNFVSSSFKLNHFEPTINIIGDSQLIE